MEIELIEPEQSTALTLPERAAVALGADKARKELTALVKKSAAIREVKNTAGRDECHGAAMVLVKARITIQNTGKAARDDATKFSKAVIAKEKELIAITQGEEDRLLTLRNAWDEARAAEKAEAERIEHARIKAIVLRIADIRECAVLASQCRTAADSYLMIQKLSSNPLEGFEEFIEEAFTVRDAAIVRMSVIHVAKLAEEAEAARAKAEHEAEAQRITDERAQLAKERAEQAEATRQAKAEAAATQKALDDIRKVHEAELQARRDAIAAEQEAAAAQMRADRQRMADERAELDRLQAEIDRKAQAARQAEADRVAAQARALEVAAVREIAAIAESDPIFEQRDGGGELLQARPGPSDDLEGPSDGEIIAAAVTAVADIFCCTPKAALNRLAEIEEWTVTEGETA